MIWLATMVVRLENSVAYTSGTDFIVIGQAFGMIAQHLQHPAIGCLSAAALMYHALEFGAKGFEPGEALFDLFQLPSGDGIRLVARPVGLIAEVEQIPDRLKGKAQLTRMPNESETVVLAIAIATLPALGAARLRHQPDLLIIADRLHLGTGFLRQITDGQHAHIPESFSFGRFSLTDYQGPESIHRSVTPGNETKKRVEPLATRGCSPSQNQESQTGNLR